MQIVFLDQATIAPTVRLPEPSFTHQWQGYDQTKAEQVVQRAQQAEIVISNKVPLKADTLKQLPKLRLIAVPATGYNHIDIEACKNLGVQVCHVPDYAQTTVPEHVFALIFALQRQLLPYQRSLLAGRWQQSGQFCYFDYPIRDLKGSYLGLVGAGALGSEVARIASALGMHVLQAEHKGAKQCREGYVPFEQMLEQSDIISLHCPLTPQTHHLLDAQAFAQMQRQPMIINTARGALIDPDALVHALQVGQIRAAGIDVCEIEPPPADHPYMQLVGTDHFILTPHIGWASIEAMQFVADQTIANINAFVAGQPIHLVQ